MPLVPLLAIISGSQMFAGGDLRGADDGSDPGQTLVDAFWQSYQKIHSEEFLLEQLERIVHESEEPTQLAIDELEMNETCVATAYAIHVPGNLGRTRRSRSLRHHRPAFPRLDHHRQSIAIT